MFVGHGLVAFALAAAIAHASGWSRDRALAFGVVAGGFALAPDVDILYAPAGLLGAATLAGAVDGFWSTGNLIHRAVTHSLVVAPVAALASALYHYGHSQGRRDALAGSLVAFCGLAAVAGLASGYLGVVVMAALGVACLVVVTVAERAGLGSRAVGAAALFGLCSHPFGDLFTGEPPAFFYPFHVVLFSERVTLSPDPTLHLLGAMGIELATFWLALLVFLHVANRGRVRDHVNARAALGLGYAAVAFVVPAPTLEVSYQFVFSVLGLGVVSATPLPRRLARAELSLPAPARTVTRRRLLRVPRPRFAVDPLRTAVTALTAATLAALTYAAVYVGLLG
ncbi:MAG: metal-dependent hydrolase [Haloarculaceae archaeon]